MMAEADAVMAGTVAPAVGWTHWDRIAQTTRWGRYLSDVEQRVIMRGAEVAGPPGKAIDLGCGSGRWSKLLAARGWEMTCVDISSQLLALCRRNVPSAKFILSHPDQRRIHIGDGSVSLVLCIEVVPLIESDWFAAEAHRVLTDGGAMVGVYINGRSLRGLASRLKNRLSNGNANYDFYQSSYPKWRTRFVASGFEMVHEESCCWGPFTRDSNSPFVPACARMERLLGLHRIVTWSPWVVFVARKVVR